jgi:sugar/nucleoside kinase (ribokinase family)
MKPEVLLLPTGRPFVDLIFAGIPEWIQPGQEVYAESFGYCPGGSVNIANACARLGINVGYCAHLGTDPASKIIRQGIIEAGISTELLIEHDRSMAAVTVSVSRSDDRAFLSYVDPLPDFDPAHLPEHETPQIVFIPGLPDEPEDLFDYLDQARDQGSLIACDCQHTDRTIDQDPIKGLIQRLDLFLCNEKEAAALTGRSSAEHSAAVIGSLCPEVVVKLGSDGALACEGGLVTREKATKIDVVDTTGAGDGFDAGYLYGLLEGMIVERRLRLGNVVGGRIAGALGGCAGAPSVDEMLAIEKQFYDKPV